jgi:hypothetical protein
VGLFYPLSDGAAEGVTRKITHYGKYSYLTFKGGQIQDKGFWPVQDSPPDPPVGTLKMMLPLLERSSWAVDRKGFFLNPREGSIIK